MLRRHKFVLVCTLQGRAKMQAVGKIFFFFNNIYSLSLGLLSLNIFLFSAHIATYMQILLEIILTIPNLKFLFSTLLNIFPK